MLRPLLLAVALTLLFCSSCTHRTVEAQQPPTKLSAPPTALLLGTWVGTRVEHVPQAQHDAALAIGQAMHLTFTRTHMITSLNNIGERRSGYSIVERSPKSITLEFNEEHADGIHAGRRVMLTFRSDDAMLMPLQGRSKLILKRASHHR